MGKWPDFVETVYPFLNFLLDFALCLTAMICSYLCSHPHLLFVIVYVIFFALCRIPFPKYFFPTSAHFSSYCIFYVYDIVSFFTTVPVIPVQLFLRTGNNDIIERWDLLYAYSFRIYSRIYIANIYLLILFLPSSGQIRITTWLSCVLLSPSCL